MKRGLCWLAAGISLVAAAHAQGKAPRLTFDVASIRLSDQNAQGGGIKPLDGGHGYTAKGIPVKLMISLMYKVPMRQISGGPEWLNSDRYDVEARADGSYSLDDLHIMFQNLLADRFKLTFHKEIKEGNVYALTIDSSGLKLKENDQAEDFRIPMTPGPMNEWTGIRVPMPYLCWWLGQQLQRDERPVIDKTGLEKKYDFKIAFMPILPPDFPKENIPPELLDKPSIQDALKQQLGLRIDPTRGPVEHFAIDHVERPSEN
jgi:uncharacterized protein (TIGR03435 family)